MSVENTQPEPSTHAVGPPFPHHLGPSGGSLVPLDVLSGNNGHHTAAGPSECELRVVPATKWKRGDDVYPLVHSSRGICVIFNNDTFEGLKEKREGSEHDVKRMKRLFEDLHFKCIEHSNLTASDMKTKLQQTAELKEHAAADCT